MRGIQAIVEALELEGLRLEVEQPDPQRPHAPDLPAGIEDVDVPTRPHRAEAPPRTEVRATAHQPETLVVTWHDTKGQAAAMDLLVQVPEARFTSFQVRSERRRSGIFRGVCRELPVALEKAGVKTMVVPVVNVAELDMDSFYADRGWVREGARFVAPTGQDSPVMQWARSDD